MKGFRLMHYFYARIRWSAFVLFCVVCISSFQLVYVTGMIRYESFMYSLLKNANMENGVYVQTPYWQEWGNTSKDKLKKTEFVTQNLLAYEGVECVIFIRTGTTIWNESETKTIPIVFVSEDMLDLFGLKTKGKVDWEAFRNTSPNNITTIVAGHEFQNINYGSQGQLKIYLGKGKYQNVTITQVGSLKSPYVYGSFNGSSTQTRADALFSDGEKALLVYETPELINYFAQKNDSISMSTNFFVVLEEGVTRENAPELFEYMENYGDLATYDEIVENTKNGLYETLKNRLPIPMYMIFVTIISLISLSVITVHRKIKDAVVYHICGCSKRNIFLHFLQSIGVIYWVAIVLNIGVIMVYPYVSQIEAFEYIGANKMILDEYTILYLILYGVVLLCITAFIPVSMMKGKSIMSMLRRVNS